MIPNVNVQVADGGLGILPADTSNVLVTLGVSSKGAPNTLYGLSDLTQAVSVLGQGPLTEALALKLQYGGTGNAQYVMPITPSQAGAASSVTRVAVGAGVLSVGFGPLETITINVYDAGGRGAATFTYQIGSGPESSLVTVPSNGTYAVPGTLTTVQFNNGSFDGGDSFVIAPTGAITSNVGNTGDITSQTSNPCDTYNARVQILSTGAPGTGAFRYALDYRVDASGNDVSTWSPEIRIPGGFKYAIPNTGVVLTFSNASFAKGDTHSFRTVPAGFTASDLNAAFAALLGLSATWGGAHVVGVPASASAANTLATALDAQMTTAFGQYRFAFGLCECPTVGSIIPPSAAVDSADNDSTVAAAFTSQSSIRLMVGAGDAFVASPISGRFYRRNAAWLAGARLALVPIGEDLARFARGALSGVAALARDESATPALDAARFVTLRSFVGQPGYFITNGRIMSGPTSDYQYAQAIRVVDRACEVARSGALKYLNAGVRVNSTNGHIDERDALAIEADLGDQLRNALVSTGAATAAGVQVDRTVNLVQTPSLPIKVNVTPLGYLKSISITVALSLQG